MESEYLKYGGVFDEDTVASTSAKPCQALFRKRNELDLPYDDCSLYAYEKLGKL